MSDNLNNKLICRTSGGCNQRTGYWDFRDVKTHPMSIGETFFSHEGILRTSVLFDRHNTPYCATMLGDVMAFRFTMRQRDTLWKTRLSVGIMSTPAISDDDTTLFVATLDGNVYALKTSTGEILWQTKIPSKADPRILSDVLYLSKANLVIVSSWGGRYVALNGKSGKEVFSWSAGISSYAAASADNAENIYTVRAEWSDDRQGVVLSKVDPHSGEETILFHQPAKKRKANRITVAAAPVVDEKRQRIILVANDGADATVYAISMATGKPEWDYSFDREITGEPTLLPDGSVCVADRRGALTLLSDIGELRWRFQTDAYYLSHGAIVVWKGKHRVDDGIVTSAYGYDEDQLYILIADHLGIFYRIDATNGAIIRKSPQRARSVEARMTCSANGYPCIPGTRMSTKRFY